MLKFYFLNAFTELSLFLFQRLHNVLLHIGVNVLSESAILVLVWETLSMHIGVNYKSQSVVFKDIQFHGEVTINPDIPFKLSIAISRGNNNFEVRALRFLLNSSRLF